MSYVRKEELAEGVVLYQGDSLELLLILPPCDLFMADPPYGVSGALNSKTAVAKGGKKNDYSSFTDSFEYVSTVAVPIVEMLVGQGVRGVVTPGNACLTLYPRPQSFGAIFQPASVGLQAWGRADAQPILYYGKSPYGGKSLPSKRCSYQVTETAQPNGHPCPKPVGFWTSLMQSISLPGETVIDPFMGSGTTGVAAVKLGRKFTGIEIDGDYFSIACRRIEQALREPDLFIETPKRAAETPLLPGM